MRILVTGGAGYIGSHACKAMHNAGHEPIVFDNLSTGHRWAVKWGPLIVGELADSGAVRRTLREHRIQAVVHFAASAYVGESVVAPRKYFRNNVCASLNLLDAMLEENVRHIVFSSSCATYGAPRILPIHESHPQQPVNPYGESKLFVERALQWYGTAYGLHWVALRYFNAAGADLEGDLGELHEPETHLIPLAIRSARRPDCTLQVCGTDYPTADGTAIRDYVHVADLAAAHVQAIDYLSRRGAESIGINLGTGCGLSVQDIIRAVERHAGTLPKIIMAPRRPGDPERLVADNSLALRTLDWLPRYSDVDTIISSALNWHLHSEEKGLSAGSDKIDKACLRATKHDPPTLPGLERQ